MKSRMRRASRCSVVTRALAVIGVTAGPGLAQGPSPAQLAEQGWTCFVPPVPGIGARCFNPAQGRPPIPPLGRMVVRHTWPWHGTSPASSRAMSI